MRVINPLHIARNIDAPGMADPRRGVAAIQKAYGAEQRKAAAKAKRDRRAALRAERAS